MRIATARRAALGAQGLTLARPDTVDVRHLRRVFDAVGLVQIDSVNVAARAHDMWLYSRLGAAYRPSMLHDLAYRRREVYESWAHVASYFPSSHRGLLAWKHSREHIRRWFREGHNRQMVDMVRKEVEANGPMTVGQLPDPGEKSGPWWGWSAGKQAMEYLFAAGEVAVANRLGTFERVYDLTERVLPPVEPVPEEEARRRLVLLAAGHLGVATIDDLADYHRQKTADIKPRLAELVEEGLVVEVDVEGWTKSAYAPADLKVPRRLREHGTLLSPFDPITWKRDRARRLFGFEYTIEIYVPQPNRVYGYYVLPFLLGDRLAARVDVKADRKTRALRVESAWAEPGEQPADELAVELRHMADWLGLVDVAVADRGDLAPALRRVVA